MLLVVEVAEGAVWRAVDGATVAMPADAQAILEEFARRYARAAERDDRIALLETGRDLFAWLDQGSGRLEPWAASGEPTLEIRTDGADPTPLDDAVVAAPWEVLARGDRFLADADDRLFVVSRRCAPAQPAPPPVSREIGLMFMAAAPEGASTLDYEAEESLILEATLGQADGRPLVHLTVEESGTLAVLQDRLVAEGPFEALHLTCHGDILEDGGAHRPVLLLEDEEGRPAPASPGDIVDALGAHKPRLVFVSACRTAERGRGRPGLVEPRPGRRDATGTASSTEDAPALAKPLARTLARHVADVIGWDGSVYDKDAGAFAQHLYDRLARRDTVPRAAGIARRELLRSNGLDPNSGRHWHLARVYCGATGGAPLCGPDGTPRKAAPSATQAFLDAETRRVPVASRAQFVGRRRPIQAVFRAWRQKKTGVVINAMGAQGKSSLAARVAERCASTHRLVLVHGAYGARAIFGELEKAVEAMAKTRLFAEAQALRAELKDMRAAVHHDAAALEGALGRLLAGVFARAPILLVIDDLEQALVDPREAPGRLPPKAECRVALAAVVTAMAAQEGTDSRLLVTTRFDFTAPDAAGRDVSATLARVGLPPMTEAEQAKQRRARLREAGREDLAAADGADLAVAVGHPGAQEALTRARLDGDDARAAAIVHALKRWTEAGERPAPGSPAAELFERLDLDRIEAALTGTDRTALAVACLFEPGVPIPRAAIVGATAACGVDDAEAAVARLVVLGCIDDLGARRFRADALPVREVTANPFARPLAAAAREAIDVATSAQAMSAAFAAMAKAWRDAKGDFPEEARGIAAAYAGVAAAAVDPAALEAAAAVAMRLIGETDDRRALDLGTQALDACERQGHAVGATFLVYFATPAVILGDSRATDLVERALALPDVDLRHRALLSGLQADMLFARGDRDGALRIREAQIPVFEALGDRRELAMAKGAIADVLFARGDLNGALRIRQQDELPVYEAYGDRRSVAVAKGKIADVLFARGDLDEALRIRLEEQVPVFEALNDRREQLVTKGKIAEVLFARGDLEDALAAHLDRVREARAIGDVDSLAHSLISCWKIRMAQSEVSATGLVTASDELREGWELSLRLNRPDYIAACGALLGKVLANIGHPDARPVLETALAAAEKIRRTDFVAAIRETLAPLPPPEEPPA